MNEFPKSNQLIVGLPETGKTTFLAALWYVVTSEEIAGSLKLDHLFGNVGYLNELSGKWASSLPLERTVPGTEELQIRMRLKVPAGDQVTELVFPDMSGEAFRQLWDDRQWENQYHEIAGAATGALLFIHPDRVQHPTRIAEVAVPSDDNPIDGRSNSRAVDWHPSQAGTAVKLVELLQLFTEHTDLYHISRLSIIVSAWDLVRENVNPEEWIARRLPLLYQYLKANRQRLPCRVYGVSAQGGDITTEADSLRTLVKQSERIKIVGEECLDHDITAPVRWLGQL